MGSRINRRNFLKGILATGSVAWLVKGSSLGGKALGGVFTNPVPFIQDPSCSSGPRDPGLLDRSLFQIDLNINAASVFRQSVASGDPRPNGIVLWTRVDPQSVYFNPQLPIAYQIATDANFSQVIVEGLACLDSAKDYIVKLSLAHSALGSFKTYYYRFIYNRCASRTGRFKTLPASGVNLSKLKFAYVSCQDYTSGYYTAYGWLAQEAVDFVIHLGDYIYEDISSPKVRTVPSLPSGNTVASSLADYRHLYRTYRSDPNLQAAHEKFVFIQIWDDHEFSDGSYREFSDTGVALPGLRQAANQAWAEYGLADVAFDPTKGPLESIKTYRAFRFGNLMELVITDERLYRDGPVCGPQTLIPRCSAAESPNRTMLGVTQRQWFIDTVQKSPALWKIWANEVVLMQMQSFGLYVNLEQWDGYPAERTEILSKLNSAGVKNLIAITGDIHSFIAGYLKANFDSGASPRVGVEFIGGSITSGNLKERGLEWLGNAIYASNLHIRYFNSSTHGYCVMEVNQSEAICTMKSVNTITSPTATLSTLKTFKVPKDKAQILTNYFGFWLSI